MNGIAMSCCRFICLLLIAPAFLAAQNPRPASRIRGSIETSAPVELRGRIPLLAQPGFDRGPVDPSLPLPDLALLFKPSPEQHADLEQFLVEQQDPSSANYHRWLTPEEY